MAYDRVKSITHQAYYDYITCLLQCGHYEEVILTPYHMSLSEIVKRATYHRKAYDIRGNIDYEMFGINFQQWQKEVSVWNEFLGKYIPQLNMVRS